MGLHKLSVGDGYTYLTRQVAAHDTEIGAGRLGAYYTERGEAPGVWLGSGMADLGIAEGAVVSEAQMTALFAHGRHPDAAVIEARVLADGGTPDAAEKASRLGTPFRTTATVSDLRRTVADRIAEWNLQHGRSACEPVGREVKSRIRTQVGRDLFTSERGRAPADARELADFIAAQSRVASDAVAGYDLTFSPVKSVSTLWAVADEATARQVEDAHHAAVVDTLAWIERTALFTRLGRNGVRQVDVHGLVAAAFTHRDSRAGDPDLHTHVAISNKVQTLDGRWRSIDGRVLHKTTVAASERYNTRLEAELRERLGIRFTERHSREAGKRGVREIAGVDTDLMRAWSSRRAAIDTHRAELTTAFQAEHGRPPTPTEAIGLAQQATLATRQRKHAPRSEAEQRDMWRGEALTQLGPDGITTMFDTITRYSAIHAELLSGVTVNDQLIRRVAARVLETIQTQRATWQPAHIQAETERQLRTLDLPLADLDAATERVVDAVLNEASIRLTRPDPVLPDGLRRADGTSVYEVAGSQLYTSRAVLAAEEELLDAARRIDGRRADPRSVDVALLEATANGVPLNAGQIELVRELAGSGSRCQLALAPAGTGKTTALRVLARAWLEDGGDLLALAPSAAAARVLREATGVRADTVAKLLHLLDSDRLTPIGPRTLVLVDEAGMAGTTDLARVIRHVLAEGGSVRLIGDDRQLAAVGAGGILRDLAEQTGTVTLDTPVRFSDPAEADATLAIRDGHPAALSFYLQQGRVHVGDEHTAPDSAYTAWAADRAAGRDTLLLAATRAQVTALNARARADRLAAHPDPTSGTTSSAHTSTGTNGGGREIPLVDGTAASAGDEIITRRNDRRLAITSTDWVKNGDRFTVRAVGQDASLTVVHRDTGRQLTLPAPYVAEHVALGYACTIHAGQGATADTSHTVLTGTESREQLYVALSRGRDANHLHLAMPGAADPHAPIRRDTLIPPTAVDLLTRILDTQTGQRSASTEHRDLVNPNRRLHDAVTRYRDGHDTAPRSILAGPAGTPPLPWLPALPRDLDQTTVWGAYLHARAVQITDLAAAATAQADRLRSPGDTRMADAVTRMDPTLVNDLALWNATHPNHPPDEQLPEPERQYAHELDKRTQAVRAVWLTRGRDPRLLPTATREALAYADQHHRRQPIRQPEPRHTPTVPRPAPPVPYHRPPPGRGVSR